MYTYWNKTIRNICRIGQKEQTCAYMGIGSSGLVCIKSITPSTMKMGNDFKMVPIGGNCNGKTFEEMNKEDW